MRSNGWLCRILTYFDIMSALSVRDRLSRMGRARCGSSILTFIILIYCKLIIYIRVIADGVLALSTSGTIVDTTTEMGEINATTNQWITTLNPRENGKNNLN